MTSPQTEKFVVDYATTEPGSVIPFIRPMRLWRAICASCFIAMWIGLWISPMIGLAAFAAVAISAVFTLVYMTLAARAEMGSGYAIRHLVLAILMSLVFLLGIWTVPMLVESDLIKWRSIEERKRGPKPATPADLTNESGQ